MADEKKDGVWRTMPSGARVFFENGKPHKRNIKKELKKQQERQKEKYDRIQQRLKKQFGKSNNKNKLIKDKNYVETIKINEIEEKLREYENEIRGKEIEYAYVINDDGTVYKYVGDGDSVKVKSSKNSIITHNHTIDGDVYRSFGEDDFSFAKDHDFKELRITNPDYDYSLKKLKKFDNISYNEIYYEAMTRFDNSDDFEIHHEAMEILKEKGFVEYERRKRKNS